MKKIITVFFFLLLAEVKVSNAQDYNWALGLRGAAISSGITAKCSLDGTNAIESILSFDTGVNVYGIYERHTPVIAPQFNLYYGGGINVGSWRYKVDSHKHNKFTAGVNAIIGLEYKIKSLPLAISVDYHPVLNFVGHTGFRAWDNIGIGVKVTF